MKNFNGLKVLAVSPIGNYNGNNTSIHRIKALQSLGCSVQTIDSAMTNQKIFKMMKYRVKNRLFRSGFSVLLPDLNDDNARLLAMAKQGYWDVIWLEKALTINRQSLERVRQYCPTAKIIGFSPDDMNGRHNQSKQFLETLPLYDFFLTTKSYNVKELKKLGCPRILFIGNGFDPETFRPLQISTEERIKFGGDVGFIGTYESERAEMIFYLASQGIKVRVWGGNWEKISWQHSNLTIENKHLYGDDFAKACTAFKINLNFLRKINRDQQTTRSVEIPACRGFMLAERTEEHLDLFNEGKEAEFFSSCEELLSKCSHYLHDEQERIRIASNGYERCLYSGYSNIERISRVLFDIF